MWLKIILYILVIYYLLRFIGSLFGARKPQQRREDSRRNQRPEGDVRIERNNRQEGDIRRNEGEYVDFEEIE